MINSVKKLAEGKYMLNDSIVVSDFNAGEEGIDFKIDFDESMITEQEASALAEEFVMRAITDLANRDS